MTPAESALLSQIGTVIYYGIVVLIVDCTLYGFYLLAEFIALYLFMSVYSTFSLDLIAETHTSQ
jgi:hypothetical protein